MHIHCKRGGAWCIFTAKGGGGRGAYSLQKREAWCIFTAKSVFWRNTFWKADRNKYLSVGSDRNMTSMEFIARWLLHGWLPATDKKYIEMGEPERIFNFTHEKGLFVVRTDFAIIERLQIAYLKIFFDSIG